MNNIIKTDELKESCNKILFAVDESCTGLEAGSLQIDICDGLLTLATTNKEYYVEVKNELTNNGLVDFSATVNAKLFIKLVSQITTETIELSINDQYLAIKGNGDYKLPLIFDNEKMFELPKIKIENEVFNADVKTINLHNILQYNSKEITKVPVAQMRSPVCAMYYLDKEGCITFIQGACLNTFDISEMRDEKILLPGKLVKLFKLLKDDDTKIIFGKDKTVTGVELPKISFTCGNIRITSLLNCEMSSLINVVPTAQIRKLATEECLYTVVVDKNSLVQALNRLLIFATSISSLQKVSFINIDFTSSCITLSDAKGTNSEKVGYVSGCNLEGTYEAGICLEDLKTTIESFNTSTVDIGFGNKKSMLAKSGNITVVMPEAKVRV